MTEQTPQEQLNARLSSIRYKVQSLQSDVRLASVRDQVEDLDSDLHKIEQRVQSLRAKGYVFGKGLEARAKAYCERWETLHPQILRQIEMQSPALQSELSIITAQMSQLEAAAGNPSVGLPMAERFERTLSTFESKVGAARSAIQGSYNSFQAEVQATEQELDRIEWMLTQLAEASFKLLPTEGAIMAVKARYARDERMEKDDPKGVLYLTDQRLIFERKEEVATKKFLFIATEKETVQELILEAPVALVEKVETAKKGLFKNEDHLTIHFGHGAPVRSAWFHLEGQDCEAWQALINRACAKDFEGDRAVAVDQKAAEKVKSAPTQCPSCGAPINQQILRGMDSVTCEYCHHVIRI